mgnify:CR=1 FL=1|jgi:NHLM bacteriocin system ABC transporter, ATP-binding protein
MSLYDEQIKQRIISDEDAFSSAFESMADVVMGKSMARAFADNRIQTRNSIEKILKYYHVKAPEMPDSIKDVNDQLDYMLHPVGIMRRTVFLEGQWWKDAAGAYFAIRKDDGTSVALLPDKLRGYIFLDNKSGKTLGINKRTAELFETEALCFYKPFPMREMSVRGLIVFLTEMLSRADVIRVVAITLISILIGFIIPKVNYMIYNNVVVSDNMRLLLSVFCCLLFVTITQMLIGIMKNIFMERITTRLDVAVNAASMMRILSLPSNFFRKFNSGELASRQAQISTLSSTLINTVFSTGLTSLFSLLYITQMISYAPGLVIPGLIIIIISVAFSTFSVFIGMHVSRKVMEYGAKESGITNALFSGVQKIKLAGAEKRAFAKWAEIYAKEASFRYDPPKIDKYSTVIATAISQIGTIVIYYFTIKTGVSLAEYYAFMAAYGMVMGAFSSLIGMATTFATIKPSVEMVRPIFEAVPELSERKKQVTKLSGRIELSHVTFRYAEGQPNVIDDLSLQIKSGQYVAIVGTTGCGKSTLMRLLLGFEIPQKGAVYYDGKDLNTLDVKSLRRKIGTVIQDGALFSGDIYSNIVVTAPQLTIDEAWKAAELAGIDEDIRNMPMEMHTMISEGSGGISGGQRQRLMIARAVAPNPKVLMFDEATSALDNITQKKISESLDALRCTRIVIAHRLSTIRHCDRILVLDHGKIIEDGTYDELISANGFFAELVARQRIDIPNQ